MKSKKNPTKNTSKKEKLLNYLNSGKSVTEKLAASQFKLKNLTATISDLREEGNDKIQTSSTREGLLKYQIVR
jgi:plasmid rolling circle replication initiator protein Rep